MMALTPKDSKHALQILAGTTGRKKGHEFEFDLAKLVNNAGNSIDASNQITGVFTGNPALGLIKKCLNVCDWERYDSIDSLPRSLYKQLILKDIFSTQLCCIILINKNFFLKNHKLEKVLCKSYAFSTVVEIFTSLESIS